jgi:ferric-dicitrate binding protein FerR (iron transport regulator)
LSVGLFRLRFANDRELHEPKVSGGLARAQEDADKWSRELLVSTERELNVVGSDLGRYRPGPGILVRMG